MLPLFLNDNDDDDGDVALLIPSINFAKQKNVIRVII